MRIVLTLLLAVGFTACDSLAGLYEGPPPSQAAIQDELAVVARLEAAPSGEVSLVLDRLAYRASDPGSVDRAVVARAHDAADVSGPAVGDTVRFSSAFAEVIESPGLGEVAGWAMNDYWEAPIAVHTLTAVAAAP